MSRALSTLLILLVLVAACSTTSALKKEPQPTDENTDTILVTVHTVENEKLLGSPARLHSYNAKYARNTRARQSLRTLSSDYQLTPRDVWPMKSLGLLCQVFEISSSASERILSELKSDPRVESVQLMNRFRTLAMPESSVPLESQIVGPREAIKNYRALQHYLDLLDIDSAHAVVTGRNVTVAIIDTHVDAAHLNLNASLSAQHTVLSGNSVLLADAHGTAVAGIIAAKPIGGRGILGIAPDAQLLAITACWPGEDNVGECNSFTLARAIDLAIAKEAQIINLSLQGPPDALLTRLIEQALDQHIVVVGAFSPKLEHGFPGNIRGVLSVAGSATRDGVFTLPGTDVLTTAPENRYDFVSGNSMAAAQLSGIAALALEASPDLTPSDLRIALNKSSAQRHTVSACQMVNFVDSKVVCTHQPNTTIPSSDLSPTSH